MADSINIQNTLDKDIVVYDSYTSDGDTNYFGILTPIGTVKAKSSLAITPIHTPVCVLIAMDTDGCPIGRYISMFTKKDITVSEADLAIMEVAMKFTDAITQNPDSDLAKKFNDVINDKSGNVHVEAVTAFFQGTEDYKTCTFQDYMLALSYRARNPAKPSTSPVEKQPYSLSALCQYLGGTWPEGFPNILVTGFKCGKKNGTLFLGGHLTLSDLPFSSTEIGKHVLSLIPLNKVEVELFFHYAFDISVFSTRIKFIADDFHIPMGNDKMMVISKPTVSLDITPLFKFVVFKAYATIPFDIFGKKFDTKITMVLDNVEAEIGVVVDGDHSSLPFPSEYPGLHFDEFGVGMGIIFEPPSVAVGLQGKFHIGSGDNIVALDDDTYALVCEFEEEPEGIPIPNPVYLAFYVPRIDLSTMINLFTNLDLDLGLPVSLQDLSFQWAENPMEPVVLPDGSLTQMAFGCSGYLELFALQFYGNLEINIKGIHGTLTMAPLEFGKLFSITGDGKGVSLKVDAQGNLIKNNQIPKTKAEKDAIKNAKLKQIVKPGGPELSISTSSSPYFSFSSKVSLFELLHENIETSISNKGIAFDLDYGAVLEEKMKCVLQDYHNLSADFTYGLDLHVPLPSHLGHIHVESLCEAGFSIKTSLSDIKLEVHGSFDFEGVKLNFGPYSIDMSISKIAELIEAIGSNILKDGGHIFSDFISDAEEWAKWVAKGVITGVEDVAKGLRDVFKKTAKETASIMKTAGFVIKDITHALEQFFSLSSDEINSTLLEAGFTQQQINKGGIMSDNVSSKILWSQFTQEIAAKMGEGASEAAIQVLPEAKLLYGKTGNEIAKSINKFAAVLPQWGSIYNPSDSTLIDAYQLVLTQIKEAVTIGKAVEKEYDEEQKKLSDMMGDASKFKLSKVMGFAAVAKAYAEAGLDTPKFPAWFKDNGLEAYQALLDKQDAQAEKVKTLLSAEGIDSPLVQARARLNEELKSIKDSVAPPVTIDPDPKLLAEWKDTPTNPGSISFTKNTSHFDYSKTVWHSQSGGKLFGFISFGHHDETHSKEVTISSSSTYTLDMDFAAQTAIDITQYHWFDGAILRQYKDGPWIDELSYQKSLSHPYGQGGELPLIPTRLYVVMNPTITIKMDKKSFSSIYDQLNGNFSNGINLGPFAFGGSNSHNSSIQKTTDSSESIQKVTITDTSNIPQVIAVVNQLMP